MVILFAIRIAIRPSNIFYIIAFSLRISIVVCLSVVFICSSPNCCSHMCLRCTVCTVHWVIHLYIPFAKNLGLIFFCLHRDDRLPLFTSNLVTIFDITINWRSINVAKTAREKICTAMNHCKMSLHSANKVFVGVLVFIRLQNQNRFSFIPSARKHYVI